MGWRGALALDYRRQGPRTIAHDRHDGPLRVLKSLYPEGDGICHSVLVHPPGGIVGGDELAIDIRVGAGAHALVTTPGATRFYRSAGACAAQIVHAEVAAGGRLEWLPLETIAYSGCLAENIGRFALEANAEMIGWDVTALGLPASGQPFADGEYVQSVEIVGGWRERGRVRADDRRLLDSPLGWNGQRTLGTLWFASGIAIDETRREALLGAASEAVRGHPLAASAGATAPHERAVVARVLAPRVEAAMDLLVRIWRAWRHAAWGLEASAPRVWRT